MRTLLVLILCCLISSGALLAATTMKNPYIGFIIAPLVWLFAFKILKRKSYRNRF